ncbi:AraC family transcriptional regulator [Marinovum sp.]|uniref:AraC-like transcriptional regulator QhpR n=1 Tax=Marinovum sp. TaxID=2024839 RepID=UPI002B26851D|nr:helix-turn-helix domain-containing protein [Marinovum sp.]
MQQCQPLPNSVIDLALASCVFSSAPDVGKLSHRNEPIKLADFASLLENIRRQDDLGVWHMGDNLSFESFGALGTILSGSPTLGIALQKFTQAFPLVQSNSSLVMTISEDKARINYRVLDPGIWPRRGDAEITIAFLFSILTRFKVPISAISHVGFEHEMDRGGHAVAHQLFCRTSFSRLENYLVFPSEVMSLPNPQPRETQRTEFGDQWCDVLSQLKARQRNSSVSDKVRERVFSRLGKATVNQNAVAMELGMSERTLRRGLSQEATSYKLLLEECRGSFAIALLSRTKLPLSEIALLLGYSDQTAFSRAFSKFAGHPPSELRSKGAEGLSLN